MYDLRWIFFFYAVHKPFTGESTRKCIGVRYEKRKNEKKKNVKTNAFIVRSYTRCRLHTRVAGRARASFPSERGKTVFLIFPQCLPTCGRPVPRNEAVQTSVVGCRNLRVNTWRGQGGERQNNLSSFIFYDERIVKLYQIFKTNVLRYRSMRNYGDSISPIWYTEFGI